MRRPRVVDRCYVWLLAGFLAVFGGLAVEAGDVPWVTGGPCHWGGSDGRTLFAADMDGDGDLDALVIHTYPSIDNHTVLIFDPASGACDDVWTSSEDPQSVIAADLDGDGHLDVVEASGAGKIQWYRNQDGDALTWSAASIIDGSATGATSVLAADVDRDGDPDVLSASSAGIRWYDNPAWSTHAIDSVADAESIAVADLDGDGDLDLATASEASNQVLWYVNDGQGNFGSAQIVATQGARSVFAADVDGDGAVDVVTSSVQSDTIYWYPNNSVGGFGAQRNITTTLSDPGHVVVSDIDQDGDADVLTTSVTGTYSRWFENVDRRGTVWQERAVSGDGGSYTIPADLDGDGDLDLLSTTPWYTYWHINETIHRSAHFPESAAISSVADSPELLAAADIDDDGDLDVLSTAALDGQVELYENLAPWNADCTGPGIPNACCTGYGTGTCVDDCTGPGSPHACCTSAGSGCSFGEATPLGFTLYREPPSALFVADLDRDGLPDPIAAFPDVGEIVWYPNGGTSEEIISDQAFGASAGTAADLDRDGFDDVIAAFSVGDTTELVWFPNLFTPGCDSSCFGAPKTIATDAGSPRSMVAADLDRDGDVDLVSASDLDNAVLWYPNRLSEPSEDFGPPCLMSLQPTAVKALDAADVDGDGDLDVLAAADDDDATLIWYENREAQCFPWVSNPVSRSFLDSRSVRAADVDGDGDVDVAAGGDSGIAWFENDAGNGLQWRAHEVPASVEAASAVLVADIDGDADPDLVSVSDADDTVSWHENRGGQFAVQATDALPGECSPLLDGDVAVVVDLSVTHRGRPGDDDLRLTQLDLYFEDEAGQALSEAQARDLIDNLYVYVDDGLGLFSGYQLVAWVDQLFLDGDGAQVLPFDPGDPDGRIAHGTPRKYLIAVQLKADASQQYPSGFRITTARASFLDATGDAHSVLLTPELSSTFESLLVDASDSDGDWIPDVCDSCPDDPDFTEEDADNDGIGDACDYCIDSDGDGRHDPDSFSPECEYPDSCPADPQDRDNDHDSVCDLLDNCPAVANSNQLDSDGDGVGDACDVCVLEADPARKDCDGDGTPDACDPDAPDSDGDGVIDFCDGCPTLANPYQGAPFKISGQLPLHGDVLWFVDGGAALFADPLTAIYVADQDADGVIDLYRVSVDERHTDERLTDGGVVSVGVVQGTTAVFVADPDGDSRSDLYSVGVHDSPPDDPIQLTTVGPTTEIRSPYLTDTHAVYLADVAYDGIFELYRVPVFGGSPERLEDLPPTGQGVVAYLVTQDDSTIVFIADEGDPFDLRLYTVPLDGSGAPAPIGAGGVVLAAPLPDGTQVVYAADPDGDGGADLYIEPIGGGTSRRLNEELPPGGDVFGFALDPQSQFVTYMASQDEAGVYELYSVPVGGSSPSVKLNDELTPGGDVIELVGITSDSTTVLYVADQDSDEVFEIYAVPLAGRECSGDPGVLCTHDDDCIGLGDSCVPPLKLSPELEPGRNVTDFQRTPDGGHVVFVTDRYGDGSYQLYSAATDGSGATLLDQVLVAGHGIRRFEITADSRTVVFEADREHNDVFELWAVPIDGTEKPRRLNGDLRAQGDVEAWSLSPDPQTRIVVYVADQEQPGVTELYSVSLDRDEDGDGVQDACDSCPFDVDTDRDGQCDLTNNTTGDPPDDDDDNDGVLDGADCLPRYAGAWSIAPEVSNLRLSHASGSTTLTWDATSIPDGTVAVYDTILSLAPDDFGSASACIESKGSDSTAIHDVDPAPGQVFYFLVRAANECGEGDSGVDSTAAPRQVRACAPTEATPLDAAMRMLELGVPVEEAAQILRDVYGLDALATAHALAAAGWELTETAVALLDVFFPPPDPDLEEAARILQEAYRPHPIDLASVLRDLFGLNVAAAGPILHAVAGLSPDLAVQVLIDVFGATAGEIASLLATPWGATAAEAAKVLQQGGFEVTEIADAVKNAYSLDDAGVVDALRGSGYGVLVVTYVLEQHYLLDATQIAIALRAGGFSPTDVQFAIDLVFPGASLTDLSVVSVRVAPDNPRAGQSVRVFVRLANTGDTAVNVRVAAHESGPGGPTVFDGSIYIGPRQELEKGYYYLLPATPGSVTFYAIVDPDDVVPEYDDGNNNSEYSDPTTTHAGPLIEFLEPAIKFDPEPQHLTTNAGEPVTLEVRPFRHGAPQDGMLAHLIFYYTLPGQPRTLLTQLERWLGGGQNRRIRYEWIVPNEPYDSVDLEVELWVDGLLKDTTSRTLLLVRPDLAVANTSDDIAFDEPVVGQPLFFAIKVHNLRTRTELACVEVRLDGQPLAGPFKIDVAHEASTVVDAFWPSATPGDHSLLVRLTQTCPPPLVANEASLDNNLAIREFGSLPDFDGDGDPDAIDPDIDDDGLPNEPDPNPYDVDTDDDGLPDGWVDGWIFNGTRWGPFDSADGQAQPWEGEDLNADGLVDAAETDPRDPDSDGDTLRDGEERRVGADPRQRDTDGDGLEDCREVTESFCEAAIADPGHEVCCEIEGFTGTLPDDADTDGDGLTDGQEDRGWMVVVFHPGLGSVVSERTVRPDPLRYDTDGDGKSDRSERSNGTDPRLPDTDGDGLLDYHDDQPTLVENQTPELYVIESDLGSVNVVEREVSVYYYSYDFAGLEQVHVLIERNGSHWHSFAHFPDGDTVVDGEILFTEDTVLGPFNPFFDYDVTVTSIDVNHNVTSATFHRSSVQDWIFDQLQVFGSIIHQAAGFEQLLEDKARQVIGDIVKPAMEEVMADVCAMQLTFDGDVLAQALGGPPPPGLESAQTLEELQALVAQYLTEQVVGGLDDDALEALPPALRTGLRRVQSVLDTVEPVLDAIDRWVGDVQLFLVETFKDVLYRAAAASGISKLQQALEDAESLPQKIADEGFDLAVDAFENTLQALGLSAAEAEEVAVELRLAGQVLKVPSAANEAEWCWQVSNVLNDTGLRVRNYALSAVLSCLDTGEPEPPPGLVVGVVFDFMLASERDDLNNELDGDTSSNGVGLQVLISWNLCGNAQIRPNVDIFYKATSSLGSSGGGGGPWLSKFIKHPAFQTVMNSINEMPMCTPTSTPACDLSTSPPTNCHLAEDYVTAMLDLQTDLPGSRPVAESWVDAVSETSHPPEPRRKVGLGLYFGQRSAASGLDIQTKMLGISLPEFWCPDRWTSGDLVLSNDWGFTLDLIESGLQISATTPIYVSPW